MGSDHAAASFDDRDSRLWMTLSAGAGLLVATCWRAFERRRQRPPSVGAVSADWLRRYEYAAGQQGETE